MVITCTYCIDVFVDDMMPEVGSEYPRLIKTLWRSMESEKLDHSVLHLLTTVIVKYMSTPSTVDLDDDTRSRQVLYRLSLVNICESSIAVILPF